MSHGLIFRAKRTWNTLVTSCKEGKRLFNALCNLEVPPGTFEPLTPVLLDSDRFERYEHELLRALKNDEVLNVALAGGYGAGKSALSKRFLTVILRRWCPDGITWKIRADILRSKDLVKNGER